MLDANEMMLEKSSWVDGGVARIGFEWLDQDLDGLGGLDQWSGWAGPGLDSPHSGSPRWKNGLKGGEVDSELSG